MNKLKIAMALSTNLFLMHAAQADMMSLKDADQICRKKALAGAHYLAETQRPMVVSVKLGSPYAEISTVLKYDYKFSNSADELYTVIAYAYPDDHSCTIGSITDNVAGND